MYIGQTDTTTNTHCWELCCTENVYSQEKLGAEGLLSPILQIGQILLWRAQGDVKEYQIKIVSRGLLGWTFHYGWG